MKPYAEFLKALPSEELFELEDKVHGLAESAGWLALVEIMRFGQEKIEASLMDGPTLSQADYARLLGFKAGLEQMPNAVQAITLVAQRRRQGLEEQATQPEDPVELAPDGLTPVS